VGEICDCDFGGVRKAREAGYAVRPEFAEGRGDDGLIVAGHLHLQGDVGAAATAALACTSCVAR